MIESPLKSPAISRLLLLVGIVLLVVVAYSNSFASMWALWQTSDHRHGILIPPIVAFLVWRLRFGLAAQPIKVDIRGLPLLVTAVVAWAAARLAGIQVLEHLVVLAMIPMTVFTLLGAKVFRDLRFPLLFLILAVPIGDALVPYLMVITADISMFLFDLSAIPAIREGQYFNLPGGNFVVADVCSGNRYLITGVMVSLLFGYLTYSGIVKRALLVAVTAVSLILTNGIRAYIVMAVASATDMQILGGRDHIYFGWLLFGIVMTLILWVGARYEDAPNASVHEQTRTVAKEASHAALPIIVALGLVMLAITVKPLQADFGEIGAMLAVAAALLIFIYVLARQHGLVMSHDDADVVPRSGQWHAPGLIAGLACVAVLAAVPRFVHAIEMSEQSHLDPEAFQPALDCRPVGPRRSLWQPRFDSPEVEWSVSFDCDGQVINVYIAAYARALQGKELISSSHYVIPPSWDRYVLSRETVPESGSDVVEIVLNRAGNESIVRYWYSVGGKVAASRFEAKYFQLLALLNREPAGGAVYVIEAPVQRDAENAKAQLQVASKTLISKDPFEVVSAAR